MVEQRMIPTLKYPVSQLCTQNQVEELYYTNWLQRLNLPQIQHRKFWEYAWILSILEDYSMLLEGKKAIGFGVGHEPLPAYFASKDIFTLATDMPVGPQVKLWEPTGQYLRGLEDIPLHNICTREQADLFIRYAPIDMRLIPEEYRQGRFDFCWSSCSLDHLGTLDAGFNFIMKSLQCLKPGGVAVHTTEFNLSSNMKTLDQGDLVLYREKDILQLQDMVAREGHKIYLNLHHYYNFNEVKKSEDPFEPHVILNVGGFWTTSIGLAIYKGR